MTRIILTRHGHVEGIHPERFRGRAELALTPRGWEESRRTAERIAAAWAPVAIYAGPLQRAMDTAAMIGMATNVDPQPLLTLQDLDYGEWQGRTFEEVKAEQPTQFETWFSRPHLMRFPGGDSLQDVVARTSDALRMILERHPVGDVVLVGHGTTNRALILQLLDQPLSAFWRSLQSPCGITEVTVEHGIVQVLRLNETGHLHQVSS